MTLLEENLLKSLNAAMSKRDDAQGQSVVVQTPEGPQTHFVAPMAPWSPSTPIPHLKGSPGCQRCGTPLARGPIGGGHFDWLECKCVASVKPEPKQTTSLYAWQTCAHEGVGNPGCSTCDPDRQRVAARYEYRLAELMTALEDVSFERDWRDNLELVDRVKTLLAKP